MLKLMLVCIVGNWCIQFGVFCDQGNVEILWNCVCGKLGGVQFYYVKVGGIICFQVGGFVVKVEVVRVCVVLGQFCVVVVL